MSHLVIFAQLACINTFLSCPCGRLNLLDPNETEPLGDLPRPVVFKRLLSVIRFARKFSLLVFFICYLAIAIVYRQNVDIPLPEVPTEGDTDEEQGKLPLCPSLSV